MSGGGAFLASIANVPRGRSEEVFAAGRVVSLDTNEFDELNECTTGWSVEHHPLGADACRSTMFVAAMRSLQLAVVQHSKGYSSQGANPVGAVSIVVPFDDARRMVHRGHAIRTMQLGMIHSGEGYECVCRVGTRFVMASVPQERMEGYARDLWHAPDVRRAQWTGSSSSTPRTVHATSTPAAGS